MSVVTDVVFVAEVREDAETYKALVRKHYDRDPTPFEVHEIDVRERGPKVPGGHVFYNGFNYLSEDLLKAMKAVEWRGTCVLYYYPEYQNWPCVYVWNQKPEPSKPWDYM